MPVVKKPKRKYEHGGRVPRYIAPNIPSGYSKKEQDIIDLIDATEVIRSKSVPQGKSKKGILYTDDDFDADHFSKDSFFKGGLVKRLSKTTPKKTVKTTPKKKVKK